MYLTKNKRKIWCYITQSRFYCNVDMVTIRVGLSRKVWANYNNDHEICLSLCHFLNTWGIIGNMIKRSFYDAICAFSYISAVVLFINSLQNPNVPDEKTLLIPIGMLSLFVLSAAMMGYFFVLGPLELLITGKKEEAVKYFFTTIVIFISIVITTLISLSFLT